jgi:hypothetical protein
MADKREFLFSFLGKETVSPAADRAEKAIGDLGDGMDDTRRDAKKLDDQIVEVEKSLKDLASQYARTGDNDFVKKIREQERELRKLNKIKMYLPEPDPEEPARWAARLAGKVGPLFVQALPGAMSSGGGIAGVAVVGTLAAELAVVLGGAVAGGIIGAAGAGGVVGGFAVASKHAAVQSAITSLGSEVSSQLEESAASFVPAAVDGIGAIRVEFGKMRGDLDGIFDDSAKFVRPLVEGVGEGVRNIVSGVRSLTRVATPAVLALSEGFGELGDAVRDGMVTLTDNADSGARALTVFFEIVEVGVRVVFGLINTLAELYEVMEFGSGVLEWLGRSQKKHKESNTELTGSLGELMKGFQGSADAASTAAQEYRSLSEVVDEIVGKNLSLAEAEVAAQQAVVDSTKAIKENGKTRNTASQAYRDNQTELLGLAEALNRESAAADESGVSSDQAAAMHKRHADALYAAARAAGRTDAEAKELVKTWLRMPKSVTIAVKSKGIPEIKGQIAGIQGKTITIAMRLTGYTNVSGTIAALRKNQRWGGIDYAMAAGGAIEAHYADSPTVLYGERETGGEAFVPRHGDRGRSMQILEKAAGWYGADVVPRGQSRAAMAAQPMAGGGGMAPQVWEMPSAGSGLERMFLTWLQGILRTNPGVILRARTS